MNTAYKSNVYPIKPFDNEITKSRSKKEILLDNTHVMQKKNAVKSPLDRMYRI